MVLTAPNNGFLVAQVKPLPVRTSIPPELRSLPGIACLIPLGRHVDTSARTCRSYPEMDAARRNSVLAEETFKRKRMVLRLTLLLRLRAANHLGWILLPF